ncbi:hypothetical protein V8C42DRAFT_305902 [Trichoderma barbatum]
MMVLRLRLLLCLLLCLLLLCLLLFLRSCSERISPRFNIDRSWLRDNVPSRPRPTKPGRSQGPTRGPTLPRRGFCG